MDVAIEEPAPEPPATGSGDPLTDQLAGLEDLLGTVIADVLAALDQLAGLLG